MERFSNLSMADITRLSVVSQEIEDRWLLEKLPNDLTSGQRIEQGFLLEVKDGDLHIRIRKTTDMASQAVVHTLTVKHRHGDRMAVESNTRIPVDTFEGLRQHSIQPGTWQVKIRRYRGPWTVDEVLQGKHAGSVVAEYEYQEGSDPPAEPPEDFVVEEKL